MDRVLYLSGSNADRLVYAQSVSANNLANVNTTGFKADLNQLTSSSYDMDTMSTRVYSVPLPPITDFNPGALIKTDNPLDVAIKDQGFFAVLNQEGKEAYTRIGNFYQTQEGMVMTGNHLPVLGEGGPISIPQAKKIDIAQDGTISYIPLTSQDNIPIKLDRIKLVLPDLTNLSKKEDGLFYLPEGSIAEPNSQVQLSSGFLESSNVNAIAEMTNIIQLARQFEISMKLIQTAEKMEDTSAQILQL
jgi:flagellar basal-body rod protein FlgF